MKEITVAGWNILADDAFPQSDRLDSIRQSVAGLNSSGLQIDVVGLCEVQGQAHGQYISRGVFGHDGAWQPHSRRRLDEHIGITWTKRKTIEEPEFIDLGYKKKAVITRMGGVAVAYTHLKRQALHWSSNGEQEEQMNVLLEYLSEQEKAIIMADFNCLSFQEPRRMMRRAGFTSAHSRLTLPSQRTHPMPGYESVIKDPRKRKLLKAVGGRVNLDGIYQRGLETEAAGIVSGASDHALLWAKFSLSKHD